MNVVIWILHTSAYGPALILTTGWQTSLYSAMFVTEGALVAMAYLPPISDRFANGQAAAEKTAD
jgi:hypothetical protein